MSIVLNDVVSPNSTSVMNANFQKIEDAINDDLLKREVVSGEANEMRTHLDMNSNRIGNLANGINPQDAATLVQMEDNLTLTTAQAVLAEGYADSAEASSTTASNQAGVATAQAVIATDQATISTNKAAEATGSAASAAQSAIDAQAIADGLPTIDIATFIQGLTVDGEKLITYVVNTAFDLPAGLTGSNAYAEVGSTVAATFDVKKNGGSSLGTINFAIGASVATFTFSTLTSFVAGDRLQVVNQATADTTLADVSITLRGNL